MRVAALYDVHGNLPALEAVLGDVTGEGVDDIVVGGDVLWGPQQVECVALLRSITARFVRGNCERSVLQPTSDADRWCSNRLDDGTRAFVSTWPLTIELPIGGRRVVFCHATPRDDDEILTAQTPVAAVRDALGGLAADMVVYGHTHVQLDRTTPGAPRLVNAGSVGLPYQGEPGAFWALIGPDVELRRSAYDVDDALERLGSAGFPPFVDVFPESLRGLVSAASATAHFESRRGA